MNYLFRYLSTLKPHETGRLDALELAPRERQTLDDLMAVRSTSEPSKADALARLGMSASMFDKTCSTLLRDVFAAMEAGEGMALLQHLLERGVYDLFLHELRRQEKECVAKGENDLLARFYADAFGVLHLRFSSAYPERMARAVAAKYKRLVPGADTEILIEATFITVGVWAEAAQRQGEEAEKKLERRLRRNDARITGNTGVLPRFRQLKAWITYLGQLGYDPSRRLECLRAAAALCEKHPDLLPLREKVLTLCQIAEEHYYYRTDLAAPFRMYREIYERYPELLRNESFHTFKFIQLAIINGDYRRAEELLGHYFGAGANMVVHGGGRSKDVALLWTKLRLMMGRYDEARAHLEDAFVLNQKGFYVQFEIECRMLHTALSFLEGDFDLVERRLPAHIKFLRSKGHTLESSRYYPWFFKLAEAFLDERTTGKRLSPKLEGKLEEFMEGAAAQYGVILRTMRDNHSPASGDTSWRTTISRTASPPSPLT